MNITAHVAADSLGHQVVARVPSRTQWGTGFGWLDSVRVASSYILAFFLGFNTSNSNKRHSKSAGLESEKGSHACVLIPRQAYGTTSHNLTQAPGFPAQ
jgi:hypothetical protein